ncbi:hypothetical protein V8F06_011206 [Rhypophila decipiens]
MSISVQPSQLDVVPAERETEPAEQKQPIPSARRFGLMPPRPLSPVAELPPAQCPARLLPKSQLLKEVQLQCGDDDDGWAVGVAVSVRITVAVVMAIVAVLVLVTVVVSIVIPAPCILSSSGDDGDDVGCGCWWSARTICGCSSRGIEAAMAVVASKARLSVVNLIVAVAFSILFSQC